MSLQNLFVAKLPRNITDTDLQELFAAYGPTSAKIMLDAATGKSKGFGFVLFASEKEGKLAFDNLNRKSVRCCGHNFTLVIYPSQHNGKVATIESNALYIRNIPMSVPKEQVETFLGSFGKIKYCALREDHYGSPVWVIYAEYDTVKEAQNALQKLHGNSTYFQNSVPILAKFEDSDSAKKERKKRREGAHSSVLKSGCIFPPPRPHDGGEESGHQLSDQHTSVSGSESLSAPPCMLPHGASNGGGPHYSHNANSNLNSASGSSGVVPFPYGGGGLHQGGAGGLSLDHGGGGQNMSLLSSFPYSAFNSFPAPGVFPNYFPSGSLSFQGQDGSYGIGGSSPSQPVGNRHGNGSTSFPPGVQAQLLEPTPGYCYTLGDSGQRIFIPASSMNPNHPSLLDGSQLSYSNHAGASHTSQDHVGGGSINFAPGQQQQQQEGLLRAQRAMQDHPTLLNGSDSRTATTGQPQFVLMSDAMNVNTGVGGQ